MRQDTLDDKRPLEARRTLDTCLEHIGHTAPSDAFEQRVFAEWNRLRQRYTHGFTSILSRNVLTPLFPGLQSTGETLLQMTK
jgi:hypothetical protein